MNANDFEREDEILKKIFRESGLDVPSDDFTGRVMNKIEVVTVEQRPQASLLKKLRDWYLPVFTGIVALGLSVFYLSDNYQIFPENYDPLIVPVFKKIFLGFQELVPELKISSFTIVIILSIAGLFLLDRLISRFKTKSSLLFAL